MSLNPPPCDELTTKESELRENRVKPLFHTLVSLLDDFLLVVDILQEHVEGAHALFQTALQIIPVFLGNDSGHRIKGEKLLVEHALLVNPETDSKPFHPFVDSVSAVCQFLNINSHTTYCVCDTLLDF